jgi:hypothetical protein
MAADISDITESNHQDMFELIDHVLTDLHDACRMLRDQGQLLAKHDRLLEEFRPLLDTYRAPLASMISRKNRRSGNG